MSKQRRIALKIHEWVEKGPYFHKMTRKKFQKKIVFSTLEPRTEIYVLLQMVCFLIAGHKFCLKYNHVLLNYLVIKF